MPVTIVVGGQYGSEGKGKVVALLASRAKTPWLVRCGGPNSGHTVRMNGKDMVLRQVPSCTEPGTAVFCIAAGCAIDESLLLDELDTLGIPPERVLVDPRAVIVTDEDRESERRSLREIASTCSGTGSALMRRMSRQSGVLLAGASTTLNARCRVETVAPALHQALDRGAEVIVEGTQGFALSLLHGADYPFVTSRDTTAAGFAMEVGLSPRLIDRIVMVVRTFPIRVGGTSGPFHNEISWDEIRSLSGAPNVIPEFTSVTKRLRRVAHFDLEAVALACRYNRPSSLAVMGLDRLDYGVTGVTIPDALTQKPRQFLDDLIAGTGVPIEIAGTGFGTFEAVVNEVTSGRGVHANA